MGYRRGCRCTPCRDDMARQNRVRVQLRKGYVQDRLECAICGFESQKLHLDHDHMRLTFRGWLCSNCNQGLGLLDDNRNGLIGKAIEYLKRAPSQTPYLPNSRQKRLAILEEQSGNCGLCEKPAGPFVLDHCHQTGLVRAVLCSRCNNGLGKFGDSTARIEAALGYLEDARIRDEAWWL